MLTAKHKFLKLVFNAANQKLVDFLDDFQKLTKDPFGIAGHAIIEQFMPPQLKKSINQAHLESGTNEQNVTHLERELELNGLEAPDELQINTLKPNRANANPNRTKPTRHYGKKPGHFRNQCRLLKKQREETENNQHNPGNKNSDANTSNQKGYVNNPNNNNNKNSNRTERKASQKLFTHSVRHVAGRTNPQRNAIMEPMQLIDRLPGRKTGKTKSGLRKSKPKRLE